MGGAELVGRSLLLLLLIICADVASSLGLRTRDLRALRGDTRKMVKGYVVPLSKSEVEATDKMQFLRQLKLLQIQMKELYASAEDESFLQEDFVTKLTQQVLPEKRLATYYGEITFGEGEHTQTFPMLFDTGSCEFWVPSKGCEEKTDPTRCGKHHLYDPDKSTTYEAFGDKVMSIKYLSGAVEGPLAKDVVNIGDSLKVRDQVFGMAKQVDVPLLDEVVWDGIIGLAYPNEDLSRQGILPLFDNMMQTDGLLDSKVFSYYLGIRGGAMTFGGIDERFMMDLSGSRDRKKVSSPKPAVSTTKGVMLATPATAAPAVLLEVDRKLDASAEDDIMANVPPPPAPKSSADAGAPKSFLYAKVTDKGYWTIEIVDILLQGDTDEKPISTGACRDRPNGRCTAIVDTGTYLIYGPQDQVTNKLSSVVINSCDDVKDLPKLIFVLYAGEDAEPARLTLHPHDYTLEFRVGESESDCVLGIGPDNDDGWTFGQVFLRSFYTVFDRELDQIGFARANPRAEVG